MHEIQRIFWKSSEQNIQIFKVLKKSSEQIIQIFKVFWKSNELIIQQNCFENLKTELVIRSKWAWLFWFVCMFEWMSNLMANINVMDIWKWNETLQFKWRNVRECKILMWWNVGAPKIYKWTKIRNILNRC
jgi:hypothetical protein